MGLKRVSEARIDERRAAIGKLNERIERWQEYQKGSKTKFWENLGGVITKAKEVCEAQALQLLRQGKDGEAKVKAGEADAYANILADVDGADGKIEKAENEINLLKQHIKRTAEGGGII